VNTGDSSEFRDFRPLARARPNTACCPGADAPGFTLHACFAGSKTFCSKPGASDSPAL